jgi:hypothetical protein
MQTKACSKCKIDKPHSEYFRDNLRAIGIRCKCKVCCKKESADWRINNRNEYNTYAVEWRAKNKVRQHAASIKHHYKLSIEEYNRMLAAQNCQCKICGKEHNPEVNRGRLYVDHCHDSKAVRGLLCSKCNVALGALNDDIDLLSKAIVYLKASAIHDGSEARDSPGVLPDGSPTPAGEEIVG